MFTLRKRHLRKKRFFIPEQQSFALLNGSNLKASKVAKIKLSLNNAKWYSVPLYLTPPKLGLGCPIIMVVYQSLKDLQNNLSTVIEQTDCLGLCVENQWYSINLIDTKQAEALEKKTFSLLLTKANSE